MDAVPLTPEQEQLADAVFARVEQLYCDEARRVARLFASKSDDQLLGKTEFQLRDELHPSPPRASKPPWRGGKRGGTAGPA